MAEGETSSARKDEPAIVATEQAIVIALNEKQSQRARSCLERSGQVTFTLKEISVTRLPETLLQDSVEVD
jgi:hypothetical protein